MFIISMNVRSDFNSSVSDVVWCVGIVRTITLLQSTLSALKGYTIKE